MEEALRIIETNKSCPTDQTFAFQVRLQLLKQRAAHVREHHEIDRGRTAEASVATSVPDLLYLKNLREQLHGLMSSFPPDLLQRGEWATYISQELTSTLLTFRHVECLEYRRVYYTRTLRRIIHKSTSLFDKLGLTTSQFIRAKE